MIFKSRTGHIPSLPQTSEKEKGLLVLDARKYPKLKLWTKIDMENDITYWVVPLDDEEARSFYYDLPDLLTCTIPSALLVPPFVPSRLSECR
mmetsp:Transcript_20002/g.36327  ORF Transcript_20002/g.36327 Transcript_20002/m.36327 type:complete len:92 (-) Transcript_20002:594-869(-)